MSDYPRQVLREVGRAIGATKPMRGRFAQARAALDAAGPHFERTAADAVQAERASAAVTIATRERSAFVQGLSQAEADCKKIARAKRAAKQMAEANGALACVEQVRARLVGEVV